MAVFINLTVLDESHIERNGVKSAFSKYHIMDLEEDVYGKYTTIKYWDGIKIQEFKVQEKVAEINQFCEE